MGARIYQGAPNRKSRSSGAVNTTYTKLWAWGKEPWRQRRVPPTAPLSWGRKKQIIRLTAEIREESNCWWRSPRPWLQTWLLALLSLLLWLLPACSSSLFLSCAISSHLSPPTLLFCPSILLWFCFYVSCPRCSSLSDMVVKKNIFLFFSHFLPNKELKVSNDSLFCSFYSWTHFHIAAPWVYLLLCLCVVSSLILKAFLSPILPVQSAPHI